MHLQSFRTHANARSEQGQIFTASKNQLYMNQDHVLEYGNDEKMQIPIDSRD